MATFIGKLLDGLSYSLVPRPSHCNSLQYVLHTASDQTLDGGKAWEQDSAANLLASLNDNDCIHSYVMLQLTDCLIPMQA